MIARVRPCVLRGVVRAVTSKSCAHRALIAAALADKPTVVTIDAGNDDIRATAACLTALGASVKAEGARWRVTPIGPRAAGGEALLDCGESGSTLRFLLPVAALWAEPAAFTGHGRLPQRPHTPLIEALRAHGAAVSADTLPLRVSGPIEAGVYTLPGDVSSQYASGLMFALPRLQGPSAIRFTSPVSSKGYLDLTRAALSRFGVTVDEAEGGYDVPGGQVYRSPGALTVEGDWSAAAFWYAANALGADVRVTGLDPRSAQGDARLPSLIDAMRVTPADGTVEIDADPVPDLVPALAVAATGLRRGVRFANAGRLRAKECDRLSAMAQNLAVLGADVAQGPDWLTVRPSPLRGARVSGFGDHRIVMAMAVAATRAEGETVITDAEAVSKSYPDFWRDFETLGGDARVEQTGA